MVSAILAVLLGACGDGAAETVAADTEWPYFGGDLASTKYSPLDQINRETVHALEILWTRPAVDGSITAANPDLTLPGSFRGTPLLVDRALYVPNALGLVESFDPGSGETLWVQEPFEKDSRGLRGRGTRGVAFWSSGEDRRVLVIRGEYLAALEAGTGEPVAGFGVGGRVNLSEGLGPPRLRYRWTGVPMVVGDVVIVGSSMSDDPPMQRQPSGDVRGYDVRTGELRWTFHVIPRAGEPGNETWEEDSWRYTGHANLWALMSADEDLGYVYLPLSSATNDMYGGHRLGDNLYGQSLVCVEAETGERVWHFQTVHHGLWDYDLPTAPILADVTVDGELRKVVIQVTKQAFTFVFDRVTGEPIWPIEERPVPASTSPGERTSPTQPFPTKPPPFDRQGVTVDDLIDFTPELRAEAVEILQRYVTGPMFTPPSIRGEGPEAKLGTIQLPGSQGGADVQGAAFDPETGWLYVPSITAAFVADLLPGDPGRTDLRYRKGSRQWAVGPRGLSLFKPPYGRITAIDLKEGKLVWMSANGDGPRDHPALAGLDLPPLGYPGRPAPLLTRELLFIGEGRSSYGRGGSRVPEGMLPTMVPGAGGRAFRAFDKTTGEVVWKTELPAGTTGSPITYLHDGRQYIVVAVGGSEEEGSSAGQLVALGLP